MAIVTTFVCDGLVCDHRTESPEKDEWIVLDGVLKAYQGVRDGRNVEKVPSLELSGRLHYCGFACLEDALSFPDQIDGEDASDEVGLPLQPQSD